MCNYLQFMLDMLDNLLQNKAIRLEKLLHDLIPTVLSCMVCVQICGWFDCTLTFVARIFLIYIGIYATSFLGGLPIVFSLYTIVFVFSLL